MMLVAIIVVVPAVLEIGVEIAHLAFSICKFASFRGIFCRVLPSKQDKRPHCRAEHSSAAKQQRQCVEQPTACSGNQSFLGHRYVPRIGLFTFNNSTKRGKGSMVVMKAIVVALPGKGASILLRENDLTRCFAER